MLQKLIPLLNSIPHQRYCEPFGGGASVLIAKSPVGVETYNDLDSALVDFFRVLASPDDFEGFVRNVGVLPFSRELYKEYLSGWETEPDRIKRVAQWFFVARQSFGGRFGSGWGSVVTASNRGMARTTSDWLSILDQLPQIHQRLQRVQIENADWRVILERFDTPETLFYLDPPYVTSTRRAGGYKNEMDDEDHIDLITRIQQVEGHVVLSAYDNPIYKPLVNAGWEQIEFETACHVAGRTRNSNLQGQGSALEHQARTELVWISPGARARQISIFESLDGYSYEKGEGVPPHS